MQNFSIDYQKLNQVTQADAYPMPRIEEDLLDYVGQGAYITTPGLAKGYWQVSVAPEDQKDTLCHPKVFVRVYYNAIWAIENTCYVPRKSSPWN